MQTSINHPSCLILVSLLPFRQTMKKRFFPMYMGPHGIQSSCWVWGSWSSWRMWTSQEFISVAWVTPWMASLHAPGRMSPCKVWPSRIKFSFSTSQETVFGLLKNNSCSHIDILVLYAVNVEHAVFDAAWRLFFPWCMSLINTQGKHENRLFKMYNFLGGGKTVTLLYTFFRVTAASRSCWHFLFIWQSFSILLLWCLTEKRIPTAIQKNYTLVTTLLLSCTIMVNKISN